MKKNISENNVYNMYLSHLSELRNHNHNHKKKKKKKIFTIKPKKKITSKEKTDP